MQDTETQTRPQFSLVTAIWIAVGVVLLWALTPIVMRSVVDNDLTKLGLAGDLFGSINALFSGLAFAGVIVAILLQREELTLQRQELMLTREEISKSTAAQDESQKALNKSIYAQSYKVAMDILESPEAVAHRRFVWEKLRGRRAEYALWSPEARGHADRVGRSWETVATMIRLSTLPKEYLVQTWSVPIVRYWWILEFQTRHLRSERNDIFIGQNFEWMAGEAASFLISKNVAMPELNDLTFNSAT